MTPQVRNDDGSWSNAQPIDWQHIPGGDWEIYADRKPMEAVLYDEEIPIAVVRARTRWGLARKMRRTNRSLESPDTPTDHLANGLRAHADRDGLRGVKRAVFMDRGGHAPGQQCPSNPAHECDLPDVGAWLYAEGDASLTCPVCRTEWAPAWGSGGGDSSGWTRVAPPGSTGPEVTP